MNSETKQRPYLHLPSGAMSGTTYDHDTAAKDLAKILHGQPAAHRDSKPDRLEAYLSSGRVYIDSVDGDAIEAVWALPADHGKEWHQVASLRMIVGAAHSGLPSIMCYLKGNDGRTEIYHGRAEVGGTYADAAQALWSEMFGDPWRTLMGHISGKYGEGHAYLNGVPTAAFIATAVSLVVQLALIVIMVSNGDKNYWDLFRLEYFIVGLAVTAGALAVVQVYRHAGLRIYRKATLEIITKGLTGGDT